MGSGAYKGMKRVGGQNISNLQDNRPKTPEQVELSKSVLQFLLDLKINNPRKT